MTESDALSYYVIPNEKSGCSDDWSTCFTLQKYASQPDEYFTDHTIFYFESGSHQLNSSLYYYVWFLVGCIIIACRYSRSIAKQLGQNPVAVLATLLLMSFSKILQASIVPLSWTYLTHYRYTNETRSIVWLYDASIQFSRIPSILLLECLPFHHFLYLFYPTFFFFSLVTGFKVALTGGFFHG